jgi:hypothetical protein
VLITLRQNARAFVEKLDFVTSGGFLEGGDSRSRLNMRGKGPTAVITDLGILTPDPVSKELVSPASTPASPSSRRQVRATRLATQGGEPIPPSLPPPTEQELTVLRDLQQRTAKRARWDQPGVTNSQVISPSLNRSQLGSGLWLRASGSGEPEPEACSLQPARCPHPYTQRAGPSFDDPALCYF